jgi:hypothetical protein
MSTMERKIDKHVESVEKITKHLESIERITLQMNTTLENYDQKQNQQLENFKSAFYNTSPEFYQLKMDLEFLQMIVKYLIGAFILLLAFCWYKV